MQVYTISKCIQSASLSTVTRTNVNESIVLHLKNSEVAIRNNSTKHGSLLVVSDRVSTTKEYLIGAGLQGSNRGSNRLKLKISVHSLRTFLLTRLICIGLSPANEGWDVYMFLLVRLSVSFVQTSQNVIYTAMTTF